MSERLARALFAALACAATLSSVNAADEPPVRDPTRPPYSPAVGSKQAGDRLRLVSTSISSSNRSAVIGDQVVGIGSRIGDAVVTTIDPGRVTITRGSQRVVLRLYPRTVKETAAKEST